MEVSLGSQDERVNLYYVRPPQGASPPCLLEAYQACERFQPTWISADDCLQMTPRKRDVFICDPFEGKAFEHLTSGFKCVVVGPRCILSCLQRTEPIPQLPSPIHNTAMRGLVITTTGFDKGKKEELKTLVERMAGIYSANYHMGVTHLVANEVGTQKYEVAVEQEIPIMTGEWVSAVWQAVTRDHTQHILATDERFLSHTCPVLYGMVVCVSQLDKTTKAALKGLIEENGGVYSAYLEMSKTSVLIVSAPEGEKYTHACKWRIKCLTPDWIYDSVQHGHALQFEGYEVKRQRLSTPNSSQANTTLPPEVSQCSAISSDVVLHRAASVDETADMNETLPKERKQAVSKEVTLGLEAVESLDLQEAQKAGLFLDGCKIFLSGFSNAHLEKLRRVLNFGGATRFNQLSEAVSHMVIGKPVEEHLGLVRGWGTRPHLLYARWVTESIKLRRPAEETQFAHPLEGEEAVVEEVQRPQHSTSHNSTPAAHSEVPPEEDEVLRQYLKSGQASSTVTANGASLNDSQEPHTSRIFFNKTFTVSGYSQELEDTLMEVVEDGGGCLVPLTHPGRVHYSLVTFEGQWHPEAEEVVSHYFLEDCIDSKRLLPVEYYHVPLLLPGGTFPLEDCCITISTYTKNERVFLENLATLLGARSQDMFARKPNPDKNVVSSTHLVCLRPSGNKYQAARKWGVPAVTGDWLIECARVSRRVPEGDFLLGHTEHPKLARKKIFKDHLAAAVERRGREGGGQPSSLTTSPDRLPQTHTIRARLSQDHEEPSQPAVSVPNTHRARLPPNTKQKVREIGDSFSSSALLAGPRETPPREFYKKFYEDIKKTMKKYKRKVPLQLQEAGLGLLGTQRSEAESVDGRNGLKEKDKEKERVGNGPLTGLVVCPSRKLVDQWQRMSQATEELGGRFLHSYGPEVTHFLFQGRSNDLNREFRKAVQDEKVIVSPEWLWACQEKGARVDEVLYPHTHNPNMSLPMVSSIMSPKTKSRTKRKYSEGEKEAEEEPSQQQQQEVRENSEESKQKEILSKQLEEIGALAQMSGKRSATSGRGRSKHLGEWHRPGSSASRPVDMETQPMSGDELESQGTAITWEDPMERQARLHLQEQLAGSTEDFMDQDQKQGLQECVNGEADEAEEERGDVDEEASPVTPVTNDPVSSFEGSADTVALVFVLVGMVEEKRHHYSRVVEGLGGTVTPSPTFDPEVTHLVAESLSRSERTLAAIASGKWVLHCLYLDHSHQAGHFLKEEMYAWGNPAAQHVPPLQPENTRAQLAKAAWRWKCAMSGPRGRAGQRPFQHMVALIHSSKDRVGAFTRMIKAGGGQVVMARPPYGDLEGITHFFVEMDKAPEKVDVEAFVSMGIPCLKPIFINNYLVMDPLPEEEDHYISQYKDLLLSMSGSRESGSAKRPRRK